MSIFFLYLYILSQLVSKLLGSCLYQVRRIGLTHMAEENDDWYITPPLPEGSWVLRPAQGP
jgi:hypothetical protein